MRKQNEIDFIESHFQILHHLKIVQKDFPNAFLKDLFIRYNTLIPSSAAIERLFSLGKDILRLKRCRMTDKHFEMLLFLRANKS